MGGVTGSRTLKLRVDGPQDGSNVSAVLSAYLREHGLRQSDLARKLMVDRTYISKVISGDRKIRDVSRLYQIAEALGLPPERFGLLPEPSNPEPASSDYSSLSVRREADEWRRVRHSLNSRRASLTKHAASLYPDARKVEGASLLTTDRWMVPEPVELGAIDLSWVQDAPAPAIRGNEPVTEPYRPHMPNNGRYPHYSRAIRDIDAPSLFENRVSYRLLDVSSSEAGGHHTYGHTTYFDMVDVCEVVSHELAALWLGRNGNADAVTMDALPFRSMITDPFDLALRPVLPSIDTLTIRYDRRGGSSFLLHRRNPASVAVAGGMSHIMPAGVFQPSGIAPWNLAGDFDLWHNMLREFSEEFLGNPEHDGSSGEPIDYDGTEPFRSLNEARNDGRLRTWYFGVGLDPLTLAGEILTTAIIDAPVFDRVFAGLVPANAEGDVVAAEDGLVGLPWRRDVVYRLLASGDLAPTAAACIELTWKYWDSLTGG